MTFCCHFVQLRFSGVFQGLAGVPGNPGVPGEPGRPGRDGFPGPKVSPYCNPYANRSQGICLALIYTLRQIPWQLPYVDVFVVGLIC